MGWTNLSFTSGQVLTASNMNALQENFTAVATGSTGAPVVPGMTKAWVSFSSVGSIYDSENVSSVVRNQLGEYTITWSVPFSGHYGVTFGGYVAGSSGDPSVRNFRAFPVSSGSVIMTYLAFNNSANAKEDVQGTVIAWQL
jgi:hypothetical protein